MFKKIVFLFLTILLLSSTCYADQALLFSDRQEVKSFINEMHKKHGFSKSYLHRLFSKFTKEQKVIDLMSKQYEALPWYKYRQLIISDQRIREGVAFYKKHNRLLKRAEKKYNVPAEIIVSILGIETQYGKVMGNFPVLQSLATLAFDYPRRAKFFKSELESFLLITKEGSLDPIKTKGSFAGAMGMPQFMPSSYHHYAVDATGKGKRNIIDSTEDAINSVANYLKENGWKKGERTVLSNLKPNRQLSLLTTNKDIRLGDLNHYKLKGLTKYSALPKKMKLIVVQTSENTKQYSVGLTNFYVIMRYNNSVHYALAVHELGQKIRQNQA